MDYKDLISAQLQKINANSELTELPEYMVLTPDNMIDLDRSIGRDITENENMMARSELLASRCSLM